VATDQYFRLSYSTIRILSESKAASPALTAVLHLLCKELAWDIGLVWTIDHHEVAMACEAIWNSGEFTNFETVSRNRRFVPGEGTPGTVWLRKRAIWARRLEELPSFPRLSVAKMDGLRSGVFVPFKFGERVLGVLELLSAAEKPPDTEMLAFLDSLGIQIGAFMAHLRADEALTAAEQKFRSLADSVPYAILTIDEHSQILYANSAADKTFGYKPGELTGQNLTVVIPQELREAHQRGIRRFIETGKRKLDWQAIRLPALHRSGTTVHVEIAFEVFYHDGRPTFTGFAKQLAVAEAK
jgi:PAS domain S-box-containing protein